MPGILFGCIFFISIMTFLFIKSFSFHRIFIESVWYSQDDRYELNSYSVSYFGCLFLNCSTHCLLPSFSLFSPYIWRMLISHSSSFLPFPSVACPPGEQQCGDEPTCVSLAEICDGYSDCRNNWDEEQNCPGECDEFVGEVPDGHYGQGISGKSVVTWIHGPHHPSWEAVMLCGLWNELG